MMTIHRFLCLCVSVIFAASLFGQQAEIALDSTIDRVTVYPGFALVERVVEVPSQSELEDFVIVVGPLPISTQPSSVQTRVVGDALAVQGVELRTRLSTVANHAMATQLELQLDVLREQRIDAEAIKQGIKLQMKALQNMADYENQSTAATWGLPDTVQERLEFLGQQMSNYDADLRNNQLKIDSINDSIKDVELQMNGVRSDSGERIREVRINCFAQTHEASQIRLVYLVPGAYWQPAYDVRISPDLAGVNVNSIGQVTQSTGEDWSQVSLVLSTSMPQIGLDPPTVPSRVVDSGESAFDSETWGNDVGLSLAEARRVESEYDEEALEGLGYVDSYAAAPTVKVDDYGITTQFSMPGKVDVSMNGEAHRFSIRTIPLDVAPERYVVPSKSVNAYLRAEVEHTGDSVLLAGTAKIFLGPDYLGESTFPLLRKGDTTTLNLGVDPNLEVKYETLEDYRDDPGSFSLSSTSTITRRYRASLRLSPAAHSEIVVLMNEAVPQSNSDSVEVELGDVSPDLLDTEDALAKREDKGIYQWKFVLHPGETKAVRWGYELSFDEDLTPVVREL